MKLELSEEELKELVSNEVKTILQKRFNGNDSLENICRKVVREYLQEHLSSVKEYAISHLIKLVKGNTL